jgi:hypothetical protein
VRRWLALGGARSAPELVHSEPTAAAPPGGVADTSRIGTARAAYENSWHRAPRRQYVISLAGGISITASDGETRHIGAGEVVLVEDTTGKGHITRSSGDGPRHTIFVPID